MRHTWNRGFIVCAVFAAAVVTGCGNHTTASTSQPAATSSPQPADQAKAVADSEQRALADPRISPAMKEQIQKSMASQKTVPH